MRLPCGQLRIATLFQAIQTTSLAECGRGGTHSLLPSAVSTPRAGVERYFHPSPPSSPRLSELKKCFVNRTPTHSPVATLSDSIGLALSASGSKYGSPTCQLKMSVYKYSCVHGLRRLHGSHQQLPSRVFVGLREAYDIVQSRRQDLRSGKESRCIATPWPYWPSTGLSLLPVQ